MFVDGDQLSTSAVPNVSAVAAALYGSPLVKSALADVVARMFVPPPEPYENHHVLSEDILRRDARALKSSVFFTQRSTTFAGGCPESPPPRLAVQTIFPFSERNHFDVDGLVSPVIGSEVAQPPESIEHPQRRKSVVRTLPFRNIGLDVTSITRLLMPAADVCEQS